MNTSSRLRAVLAATVVVTLPLVACGDSDEEVRRDPITTTTDTTDAPAVDTTSTTAPAGEPLRILVSNDDGYEAEGIDTLVSALLTLDAVEVEVVAPATQQSGTGGKSTEGELVTADVELANGFEATSVEGFPADTIRVAVDEMGLQPHVVVTGINEGQNIGPVVDFSGTVGAARAAVARGIPALATSQGSGDVHDYDAAVPLILDWLNEQRDALLAGTAPVEVVNLNVPSCTAGEMGELLEVDVEAKGDVRVALGEQDCTMSDDTDFDGDVSAFVAGHPTISILDPEPAPR